MKFWGLTYWQINYLGCDSFMDTGRRCEASDSETMDSLLLKGTAVARLSKFSCISFPILNFHGTVWKGPGVRYIHTGLWYRTWALSLENLIFFIFNSKYVSPLLLREPLYLPSKAFQCLDSLEQRYTLPLLTRHAKMYSQVVPKCEKPKENYLTHTQFIHSSSIL